MEKEEERESGKQARLAMIELAKMMSVPMSLNAVIKLNIPDIIWQGGANTPLSAPQIAAMITTTKSTANPCNLETILRLLASYCVFEEHIDGSLKKKYSLTQVGKTLVTDEEGLSFGPYVLQHHQEALMQAWPLLHEAVLDPIEEPFVKIHGVSAYSYYGKNEDANDLMQKAMSGVSVPFMRDLLDHSSYDGFALEGMKKLVDVGGSSGACLHMILHKYPNLQGINFDLPEVVEKAPQFPGVIHVGGDMFKSIPSGDAIFMKWVLTTWSDDECGKILNNCYKALPESGKVIACEPVLPEKTDSSQRIRALLEVDVFVMATYSVKGSGRSEEEFRQLGAAAGFPNFRAIQVDHYYTLLEFQK